MLSARSFSKRRGVDDGRGHERADLILAILAHQDLAGVQHHPHRVYAYCNRQRYNQRPPTVFPKIDQDFRPGCCQQDSCQPNFKREISGAAASHGSIYGRGCHMR